MSEHSDEELVLAAGRGERTAFGTLVERHQRTVVHYVFRFLGLCDRPTAEDLAQEVFLSAWKAAPTFEPRAKALTWLLTIAHNTCLNHRRRTRLRRMVPLSANGASHSTPYKKAPSGFDENEHAASVRAVVARLPAKQRAAIVLRHYHDLSYAQIAEILGTTVPAVESLLFRARERLRAALEKSQQQTPQVSADLGAESV